MQNKFLSKIKKIYKQDIVLCIAVALAVISSLFFKPNPDSIDWQVLSLLWCFMLVVAGLKSVCFLDWIAVEVLNKCQCLRQVVVALVSITYISSMFVTNDVALLTFVPLALVIGKTIREDMGRVIILQTLAANLGSMLTPPGNPQNLFLYAHFGYDAARFFKVMALPCLLSLAYILLLIYRSNDKSISLKLDALPEPNRGRTLAYIGLLLLNIAAVLHLVDKQIALVVTIIGIALLQYKLFLQVDYGLLVTFIGFFVFIGNISQSELVNMLRSSMLGSTGGTYLAALMSSQFISNVPAAMLLAGLTSEADALLLGVNVGGLGTLIASMASVISYKLFIAQYPASGPSYLKMFLYYNFGGLLFIGGLTYLLGL